MSNYQNTKAAISGKWIQRALHMNEHMNKNVFMSDLCQEERERRGGWAGGEGRGGDKEMKQAGIKAQV